MAVPGDEATALAGRTPRIWAFAGCVLDERSLELKVGGVVADLDRKPLELLLHLLRHAGEVVTKDELVEAVWPGRIISDANLTKTVARVRAALGESEHAIKTVHGYGYRLVAPVSVQVPEQEEPAARFDFKPGEHPPLRPQWQLSSRLDAGGHGEVWLAHHAKTKEPLVFKFAEGGGALTGLKREVTLSRLLREMLPARDDYLRLQDWNFDEPPFFVEAEYVPGGNLSSWLQSRGGTAAVPLATRLELLAQAADALAAAHSIGVLHKDLKPANILIAEKDGAPRIKLADFGSGGVLDSGALEALGITRMGFTQVVPDGGTTSGTPLYLAPEVLAGQPFTVQSDIYALGVMLYQLVAGDSRKALAPGWENDVSDELLREDIALAAAGNPANRMSGAGALAQRLRTLEERRQQRAEAARLIQAKVKLRRLRLVSAALALIVVAVSVAGFMVWRAQERAVQAEQTTLAVNRFLNEDLLGAADPSRGPVKDLTVLELLDRTSSEVDTRLSAQPEVAASVHLSLGQAYENLLQYPQARRHFEKAATLLAELKGPEAMETLQAQLEMGLMMVREGEGEKGCATVGKAADILQGVLDPHSEAGLVLRARFAGGCSDDIEALRKKLPDIEGTVSEMEQRQLQALPGYALALTRLGSFYLGLQDYESAERAYRKLALRNEARFGANHFQTARAQRDLALALLDLGRLADADAELAKAKSAFDRWSGDAGRVAVDTVATLAFLRLEQGRFAEAATLAAQVSGDDLGSSMLSVQAEAALLQGHLDVAIERAQAAMAMSRKQGFAEEPGARLIAADVQLRQGRPAQAAATLAPLLEGPPPGAYLQAEIRRMQGLLLRAQGRPAEACAPLQEALKYYVERWHDESWRRQRAKVEFAGCVAPAAPPATRS